MAVSTSVLLCLGVRLCAALYAQPTMLPANEESPLERWLHENTINIEAVLAGPRRANATRGFEVASGLLEDAEASRRDAEAASGLFEQAEVESGEDGKPKKAVPVFRHGDAPLCEADEVVRMERVMFSDLGDFVGHGRGVAFHVPERTTEGGRYPECNPVDLFTGPNARLMAKCVGLRAGLSPKCSSCWNTFMEQTIGTRHVGDKDLFTGRDCRKQCKGEANRCTHSFIDFSKTKSCLSFEAIACIECMMPAIEELTSCAGFEKKETKPTSFAKMVVDGIRSGDVRQQIGKYASALLADSLPPLERQQQQQEHDQQRWQQTLKQLKEMGEPEPWAHEPPARFPHNPLQQLP